MNGPETDRQRLDRERGERISGCALPVLVILAFGVLVAAISWLDWWSYVFSIVLAILLIGASRIFTVGQIIFLLIFLLVAATLIVDALG